MEKTVNTLQNLIEITEEKGKAVGQTLRELNKQAAVIHQEKKAKSLEDMEAELELLKYKLESIATKVSVKDFRNKVPEKFELQKELQNLL